MTDERQKEAHVRGGDVAPLTELIKNLKLVSDCDAGADPAERCLSQADQDVETGLERRYVIDTHARRVCDRSKPTAQTWVEMFNWVRGKGRRETQTAYEREQELGLISSSKGGHMRAACSLFSLSIRKENCFHVDCVKRHHTPKCKWKRRRRKHDGSAPPHVDPRALASLEHPCVPTLTGPGPARLCTSNATAMVNASGRSEPANLRIPLGRTVNREIECFQDSATQCPFWVNGRRTTPMGRVGPGRSKPSKRGRTGPRETGSGRRQKMAVEVLGAVGAGGVKRRRLANRRSGDAPAPRVRLAAANQPRGIGPVLPGRRLGRGSSLPPGGSRLTYQLSSDRHLHVGP